VSAERPKLTEIIYSQTHRRLANRDATSKYEAGMGCHRFVGGHRFVSGQMLCMTGVMPEYLSVTAAHTQELRNSCL